MCTLNKNKTKRKRKAFAKYTNKKLKNRRRKKAKEMCEKRRFKLNINARLLPWRQSGHVRNSINGSGSILPSSLGQVCPGKTFRPPQKISLTRARVCQDFRKLLLSCCRGICRPSLPQPSCSTQAKWTVSR